MILPSGSHLEIAEACEASGVYEGIESISDASELGSVKHAYLYDAVTGDAKSALAAVPEGELRDACARIDLDKLPAGQPGRWAGEVTFAIDVETGRCRELGRNLKRRYLEAGLGPNEIPGTVDVLGLSADREATLPVEMKTGWTRVSRARDNLQLGLAAVCSTEVYERSRADGAILYVREDDDPYFDVARFEAFELVAMKERIIDIGRRIIRARKAYADHDPETGEVKKKPRLVVGKHCRFCSVQMVCPAQGALARRFIANERETIADLKKGLVENDAAALLYRRLIALKAVVEGMLGIVYARAKNAPIVLSDGVVLGEVETVRESLDGEVVASVVRELYGEQWISKATSLDTSKAAVERMARELKAAEGGTMKSHVERVLTEVSKRGGLVVKPSKTIKEHRRQLPAGEQKTGDDHG
jgi:ribosomal protein L18